MIKINKTIILVLILIIKNFNDNYIIYYILYL